MSHNTANTNSDRPKPMCHHCKELGNYRNQCLLQKRPKEQSEETQLNPGAKNSGAKNSGAKNSIPNNNTNKKNNNNNYKNSNRAERKLKTVHPPCETCRKTNRSTKKCYYGANAAKRPPSRTEDLKDRIKSNKRAIKMTRMKLFRWQPKI